MKKKRNNGSHRLNVGFISTRFAGTDGVSLETAKWAHVFEAQGLKCHYLAGELDRPEDVSMLVPQAHFTHPDVVEINDKCFGEPVRNQGITRLIHKTKEQIKKRIYSFIRKYQIHLLVPENALTIPMNIPLGMAITEVIAETGLPTIAHHHDFFWERQRFLRNSVWEYLNMAFPPHLPYIHHVVINSSAANQLALRTGIAPTIIPNVMDFETPPDEPDDYCSSIRADLGIDDDELLVLQPTRVVARKGIEHAIELISRLGMKARLVISHAAGDEGLEYERRVREFSDVMKVNTLFVSDIIGEYRSRTDDGRKIYTLHDVYPYADLITYPSTFEGFGNAFLEAVYFRKPIVVNLYSVYLLDIKPKGFMVVEMDGYVTDKTIERTREILKNPVLARTMVIENYELGKRHFSYGVLRRRLKMLLSETLGI